MEEPESLTELMTREHQRLEDMLEDISVLANQSPEKVAERFNIFRSNLEKHIFMEEKAIFRIEGPTGAEVTDAFKLLQEHGVIIGLVKKIEDSIKNREFSEMEKLMEFLDEHCNFENEVLYPNLDKKLSDDRKKEILERVNEIING